MSPAPLYRNSSAPPMRPQRGNAGLWYDKFCNTWTNSEGTGWSFVEGAKQRWIETVTVTAGKPSKVGNADVIGEFLNRRDKLVKALGGMVLDVVTIERFATGLGREHPVENGFAWHHTLGTPYLPGSSVKGVVRAWAEVWWPGPEGCPEAEKAAVIKRIFGSEAKAPRDQGSKRSEENDDKQVGSVIFFDALPVGPVQLECEIMTPHYGPYYQGSAPPADWHSPTPIPFLVTASGQKFSFAIAPRRVPKETDASASDLALVAEWLKDALQELGAGAKTAVGYGRFSPVNATR